MTAISLEEKRRKVHQTNLLITEKKEQLLQLTDKLKKPKQRTAGEAKRVR